MFNKMIEHDDLFSSDAPDQSAWQRVEVLDEEMRKDIRGLYLFWRGSDRMSVLVFNSKSVLDEILATPDETKRREVWRWAAAIFQKGLD